MSATLVLPAARTNRGKRSAAQSASTQVRLTRRGRLVVFVAALVLALTVGVLLSATSAATSEAAPTEVVMVGVGETLWDIAGERTADGDVRSMMADIKELNDLESGSLQAGQRLTVPAAD